MCVILFIHFYGIQCLFFRQIVPTRVGSFASGALGVNPSLLVSGNIAANSQTITGGTSSS